MEIYINKVNIYHPQCKRIWAYSREHDFARVFSDACEVERTIPTGDLGVDVARARFSISLFDMASWTLGGQDVSRDWVKLERRKLKRNASNPLESVNPPATASYRMQGTWTDRSGRTFACWIRLSLWRYTFPYDRGNRLNSAKGFVVGKCHYQSVVRHNIKL